MGGVVASEESILNTSSRILSAAGGGVTTEDGIGGLGGSHVVRGGTDAADALGDARHLFHRASLAKSLKAAELGHLEIGIGHIPFVIQEQGDLAVAFQARDRDRW